MEHRAFNSAKATEHGAHANAAASSECVSPTIVRRPRANHCTSRSLQNQKRYELREAKHEGAGRLSGAIRDDSAYAADRRRGRLAIDERVGRPLPTTFRPDHVSIQQMKIDVSLFASEVERGLPADHGRDDLRIRDRAANGS